MRFGTQMVRQALLAALTAMPMPVLAEITAQYDTASGTISVTNGTIDANVRLTVTGQASMRSMPFTVSEDASGLIVTPRFSLRPGTDYTLTIGGSLFDISVPSAKASVPRVAEFRPSQAVIPANTLRLYIQFTEPMARGQLLDEVSLIAADGSEVLSPFLNLETELWDAEQRRATLLLDPGRIKQGVGPNTAGGAPLQARQSYRLIVSEQMQSAAGINLDGPVTLAFRVGPAERRGIDPAEWDIFAPTPGTLTSMSVSFDRIMDTGAARRLLRLEAPDGNPVQGEVTTDGGGWSLAPTTKWAAGTYSLIVDPELEDISGNTPGVPFDAASGTFGTVQAPIILTVDIASRRR